MTVAKKPPPPWLDLSVPRSDRARLQPCPRCRQPVIRALIGNPCGLDTRTDPTPLNPTAELRARLNGHQTYCLRIRPWAPTRLLTRSPEHITAGTCTHLVLAEHHCPRDRRLTGQPSAARRRPPCAPS